MAHVIAQTGLVSSLDNRPAVATGVLGTLLMGALSVLMMHAPGPSLPDGGADELPFTPAFVMALGSPEAEAFMEQPSPDAPTEPTEPTEPEPEPEPVEPVEDEAETSPEDAVTEDPVPPTPPRPPRSVPPRPPRPSSPNVSPPRPPLPSPGSPSKGDPFGTPGGFDELDDDGDPWARAVLAALDGMDVGTVYGKPITGNVRFEITVCKDGRISRVANKGGSASSDGRDLVLLEVGRLRIPRPPPAIAATMKGRCAKLRHTFSWTARGTK